MEPAIQGSYDFTCGLHAIINMIKLLYPEKGESEYNDLFIYLVKSIVPSDFHNVYINGMDDALVTRLTDCTIKYVWEKWNSQICHRRVDKHSNKNTFSKDVLDAHYQAKINNVNTCTLIGIVGKYRHWTCITNITGELDDLNTWHFTVFDSIEPNNPNAINTIPYKDIVTTKNTNNKYKYVIGWHYAINFYRTHIYYGKPELYNNITKKTLQSVLSKYGLHQNGKKQELIYRISENERIMEHLAEPEHLAELENSDSSDDNSE